MISDADIVSRLQEILISSDLDTATSGSVRRQLEGEFGADLSDRKAFIRGQIDTFLNTHLAKPQEEEQEEQVSRHEEVGPGLENVKQQEEGSLKEEKEESVGDHEEEEERESVGECENKGGFNKEAKVKKRGGFNKLCSLSPQLQDFTGESEMARPQVVKRIWCYIKENNLQDPKNKRNIKCDESLRSLFRVNTINMFQMNKTLSKHIWPLDAKDENVEQNNRGEESDRTGSEEDVSNADQQEEEDDNKEEGDKDEVVEEVIYENDIGGKGKKKKGSRKVSKDSKKRGGGFTKLCSLSPQLQAFTGETKLARTEVVKRLWKYIRENNLQDPKNKRNIICDESFHALFHVDSVDMFQMNKALSKHIWPLNEEDGMDYSHDDLGDLIDTLGVQELAPTYPRLECMIPSPTQEDLFANLEVEATPEIVIPSSNLGNPSLVSPRESKMSKKRKVGDYTPGMEAMEAMDMDDFEFDEVVLKDAVVLETPVTYFSEGIFERTDLKRDLYHHFGTEIERTQVRATHKSERGTHGELIADRLLEAVCLARKAELSLRGYKREV